MNEYLIKIAFAVCIALAVLGSHTIVHAEQGHLEKAIGLLQTAKTDSAPLPLLRKAKDHIQDAKHNKGGRQANAIESINDAIEVAKQGGNPESKINLAIAVIQKREDPKATATKLDGPAYGRTKAFVDTDRDGKKFDLQQPERKRNPEKKSPNDKK
ncbi:MAG: hypothetical protein ABMA13_10725 [Chthoniobacteraceae bacterium]